MSGSSAPITSDSLPCQTLRCLSEKFVVDFANGIDVTRDRVCTARALELFARMYDGFTGLGARRQTEVNAGLADGVNASLQWLCELSESLAHSNLAITSINDRVTLLTGNVTRLVHYSADTREQLQALANRLDTRMQDMAQKIERIDFIQKAQLNMEEAFTKWEAGRFAAFSPAARCYAVLEELRWGALGDYCRSPYNNPRQCSDFMDIVTDRATKQLATDAVVSLDTAPEMVAVWLAVPPARRNDCSDDMWRALSYLADGMVVDAAPFANSAALRPTSLPRAVPLIANARRVAKAMVYEVFLQEAVNA